MGGASSKRSYVEPRKLPTKWFDDFVKDSVPSLEGKVIAVTGCTTGTGYWCAHTCAAKGAHVVMLNRPSERAVAAAKSVAEVGRCTLDPGLKAPSFNL